MIPDIARDACKWEPSMQHNFETSSVPARSLVTCCGCKAKVEYQSSWVTVAYGRNGVRLPLSAYVHCVLCKTAMDPTEAWMKAYRSVPQNKSDRT